MYKKLNAPETARRQKKKHNKGGVMVLLVIITALLVGGMVYIWQQASVTGLNSKLAEIKNEAGDKISELENKVDDLEKEKEEEEKEEDKQWRIFTDEHLNNYIDEEYNFSISALAVGWGIRSIDSIAGGVVIEKNDKTAKVIVLPIGELDYGLPFDNPEVTDITLASNPAEKKTWSNLIHIYMKEYPDNWNENNRIEVMPNDNLDEVKGILASFKFLEEAQTNIFDVMTAEVGDEIVDMEIVSIGPFKESFSGISYENAEVKFSGQVNVIGEYHYNDIVASHCVYSLDEISDAKLPKIDEDTRTTSFCFINSSEVQRIFGPYEDGEMANVIIDDYTIISYPSAVANTVEFIELGL